MEENVKRGRPKKSFADKIIARVDFGMRLLDCQNMAKAERMTQKSKRDILREALQEYVERLENVNKL